LNLALRLFNSIHTIPFTVCFRVWQLHVLITTVSKQWEPQHTHKKTVFMNHNFCNKNKENKFCRIYSRYSINLLISEHNTEIVSAWTSAHNFGLRKCWFISAEFGVSDCTKNLGYLFTLRIPTACTCNDFLYCESDQTGSGTHPAFYSMGTACHVCWGN